MTFIYNYSSNRTGIQTSNKHTEEKHNLMPMAIMHFIVRYK